jgi:Uma2 family endonuclease
MTTSIPRLVSAETLESVPKDMPEDDIDWAACGWRTEIVELPDGSTDFVRYPLTAEEFLHPQEGYRLPNSTFHDDIAGVIKDILTRRYAHDPTVGVYRDLIIKWGIPDFKNHCPDTFVAFGIQNKAQNRTEFLVPDEGTRPAIIFEVVSPHYRKEDRQTKVQHYAKAGVQEYVILDRRTRRKQIIEEVIGYRLVEGQYLPLIPDDEGRISCETIGVSIGLQDDKVVMFDTRTGERLLTSLEWEQRAIQAEVQITQAEERAIQAEQRSAQLAELLRSQGIDPDQL